MTDLERFKERLGDELVAAANRRAAVPPAVASPRRRHLVPVAALGLLSLVGLVIVPFVRPASVDAETFEITTSDEVTRLEIVDLIINPMVSEQQLRREVGIESDFVPVPTDAELVGRVVAIGTTGSVELDLHSGASGFPTVIDVPRDFDGVLTISYGRLAQPNQTYGAHTPHALCQDLAGQTLAESLNDLRTIRSTVVARVDLPNQRRDLTDLSLIPDDYVITMVHTVSDEIVRAFLSPPPLTTEQLDRGCRR